ncbi:MAG: alpha/beta fold hydrolase [Chitinivibrionales bacterium]|nr:alpha/beta fold hydrolase [Chitinivibrionales bacterium]
MKYSKHTTSTNEVHVQTFILVSMGPILRIFVSFFISALLFWVPREEYEQKMEQIPSMEQKNADFDLKGWTYNKIYSEKLKINHYYFSYPSPDTSAPTFVLLHGLNTDGRVFVNMHSLAKQYNLISYDLPWETHCYRGKLNDFNCILEDFFSVMELDTICLLGYSIGGAVAVHYTGSPTRITVNNLILISSTLFGATQDQRDRSVRMADKLLPYPDYKLYYLMERGRSLVRMFENSGMGENVSPEIIAIKKIGWYRQIFSMLKDYNAVPHAEKITCPVLVLHGSDDKVVSLEMGKLIPQTIKHARFEILEGLGHSMPWLNADLIAAKIEDFCTSSQESITLKDPYQASR